MIAVTRLIAMAVLSGGVVMAGTIGNAAPRGAQDTGGAIVPDTDLDVWLPRLVGKYQFEGMVQANVGEEACGDLPPDPNSEDVKIPPEPFCQTVKGKGDCVAIGNGPGVQCMFNVTWLDMYRVSVEGGVITTPPGGVSYLDPAMALFGLDPGNRAFSYLLVDHKGMPEGDLGYIKGNRATFRTPCVNGPVVIMESGREALACRRIVRLDARPDSSVVHWSMDIEFLEGGKFDPVTRFEMTMRRVPPDDESAKSGRR